MNCGDDNWDIQVNTAPIYRKYPDFRVSDIRLSGCQGSQYTDMLNFRQFYSQCSTRVDVST